MNITLNTAMLYAAGAGQIFIALIYEWVRRILDWDAGVAAMPKRLNRQITHTYSRYIQGLNFAFGLITILLADAFVEEPRLGAALAGLLTVYWGVRTVIALTYYDIGPVVQKRALFRYGNYGFSLLFALMAGVYAWTTFRALNGG
ncbi:hypothetical protein [Cerasicoccus fimbriatus]|uniref:hypothetical protein n=1 Tax=Cerasicoccus fimbriatus TaxID=3014554 RepID=UPI0022B4537F|nr:hypothetical protein [Cerasicoccus sp. TK19100]